MQRLVSNTTIIILR